MRGRRGISRGTESKKRKKKGRKKRKEKEEKRKNLNSMTEKYHIRNKTFTLGLATVQILQKKGLLNGKTDQ